MSNFSPSVASRSFVRAHSSLRYAACCLDLLLLLDRFVGLVVKASASRAEDPEFESRLRRFFFFFFFFFFFAVQSYQ